MALFRKKPVVIEAVEFLGFNGLPGEAAWSESPDWLDDAFVKFPGAPGSVYVQDGQLMIGTLESPHEASKGDWIIKGIKGELYPCKPDIFAATYEAVEV